MKKTRTVYKTLGDAELQFGVSDEEILFGDLFKQDQLFLGYYSEEGLDIAMEEYGIKEDLASRGFPQTRLKSDEHANGFQLQITSDDEVLIDVVLDIAHLNLGETLKLQAQSATHRVLYVHWMEMCNPQLSFSSEMLPLPAQLSPGLGLGMKVFSLLENVCRRLDLDAIVAVPMYFHNAIFYSRWFRYADPKFEGKFKAVQRDSKRLYEKRLSMSKWNSISATSWSFVLDPPIEVSTDETEEWFTEPMIAPFSDPLKKFLQSDWYDHRRDVSADLSSLVFPENSLFCLLEERGLNPYDEEKFQRSIQDKG